MVLAKPATAITPSTARARRCGGNQETTTVSAVSYSTIAAVTPTPAITRYSAVMVWIWDQAATRPAPRTDPPVISARPPCRSNQRPTGTAQAAPTSTETASAPVTAVVDAWRDAAIGWSRTANV